MDFLSATEVRKNWSLTLDNVVREKPAYIKRTHDEITMMDINILRFLLTIYRFNADKYIEKDGSVTLSLREIDLVVNSDSEDDAKDKLIIEIKDYAEDYYDNFQSWSNSPNRQGHIPFVLKALITDNYSLKEDLICLDGKN